MIVNAQGFEPWAAWLKLMGKRLSFTPFKLGLLWHRHLFFTYLIKNLFQVCRERDVIASQRSEVVSGASQAQSGRVKIEKCEPVHSGKRHIRREKWNSCEKIWEIWERLSREAEDNVRRFQATDWYASGRDFSLRPPRGRPWFCRQNGQRHGRHEVRLLRHPLHRRRVEEDEREAESWRRHNCKVIFVNLIFVF